jgi:hypothetical protein
LPVSFGGAVNSFGWQEFKPGLRRVIWMQESTYVLYQTINFMLQYLLITFVGELIDATRNYYHEVLQKDTYYHTSVGTHFKVASMSALVP